MLNFRQKWLKIWLLFSDFWQKEANFWKNVHQANSARKGIENNGCLKCHIIIEISQVTTSAVFTGRNLFDVWHFTIRIFVQSRH